MAPKRIVPGASPRGKKGAPPRGQNPALTKAKLAAGGKQLRLRSLGNVRAAVSKVLRLLMPDPEAEVVEPQTAAVIFQGYRLLANLIEGEGVEARLKALEAQVAKLSAPAESTEPGGQR